MIRKPTPRRYLWMVFLAFLVACGKQTVALPTETLVPTVVSPTPTSTVEIMFITVTPSPLPPQPTIALFTPEQEVLKSVIQSYFEIRYLAFNTLQLDGFSDLVSNEPDAKVFLDAELGKLAVEIKHKRMNNLRYAYYKYFLNFRNIAIDASVQMATVSVVEDNEVIYELSMELTPEEPIVSRHANLEHTIILREEEGQWKIVSDYYNDYLWRMLRQTEKSTDEITDEMLKSIKAGSLPTQAMKVVITPEPDQLERWMEYENALAKKLMPLSPSEKVLCEWNLSGRSDQEVYVWAVCMSIFSVVNTGLPYHAEMPAVIHIGADGAIQSVEIPGIHYAADIRRMFPPDAQERYFEGLIHFQELTDHLRWRREHPEEPPLIVLSTTPTP